MAGRQEMSDSALKSLQGELEEMFASIRGRVAKLDTLINNLEGQWQGIGRGAFDSVQVGIKNDLGFLNKLLDGFVGSINDTRRLSSGNEDDVLQRMQKIQGMSGMEGISGNEANTTQGSLAGPGGYGSKLSGL